MLVYSYLQLHSTATEAEKAIWFKNNRTTTALLALFAVEEQVKLFVAKAGFTKQAGVSGAIQHLFVP